MADEKATYAVLLFDLKDFDGLDDQKIEKLVQDALEFISEAAEDADVSVQEMICAVFECAARLAAAPLGIDGREPNAADRKLAKAMGKNVTDRMLAHMQCIAPGGEPTIN